MKIVQCTIPSIATGMEHKTSNEDYKITKYRRKREFTNYYLVSLPDILLFKVFICLRINFLKNLA